MSWLVAVVLVVTILVEIFMPLGAGAVRSRLPQRSGQVRADGVPDPDLFPLPHLHVADGGLCGDPQRARPVLGRRLRADPAQHRHDRLHGAAGALRPIPMCRPPSGSPSAPSRAASRNWRWSMPPSGAPASCRGCTGRRFDADVRRFWILAIPAMIAGGITQINIFVGTIIASARRQRHRLSLLCRPALPAAARHHRHRHRHRAAARTSRGI